MVMAGALNWQGINPELVGTRIIDWRASDYRPAIGQRVTFMGILQHHKPPLCWYNPLAGATVWLTIDGERVMSDVTDSGGAFKFEYFFKAKGIYWVKACFDGNFIYSPSESMELAIEVISPEEKAEEERRFWLMVGIASASILALIGACIWYVTRR